MSAEKNEKLPIDLTSKACVTVDPRSHEISVTFDLYLETYFCIFMSTVYGVGAGGFK